MAFDDTPVYVGPLVGGDLGSPEQGNSTYLQINVAASRPAQGNKGVFHFATDTLELTYDDGAAWQSIGHVVELTTTDDSIIFDGTKPIRLQNALSKTAAPGVTDDTNAGYAVGSTWIDTTADKAYLCLDSTAGAAVWTEITQSGGDTLVATKTLFTTADPGTTRATLITPASGKKIRIIGVLWTRTTTAANDRAEIYFGTGASMATDATKAISEMYTISADPDIEHIREAYRSSDGPVGAVDEVVSHRHAATAVDSVEHIIVYTEE